VEQGVAFHQARHPSGRGSARKATRSSTAIPSTAAGGRIGRLCRLALDQPQGEPKVLVSRIRDSFRACGPANGKQILFWQDPDFSASAIADGLELFGVPAGRADLRAPWVYPRWFTTTCSRCRRMGPVWLSAPEADATSGAEAHCQKKKQKVIDLNTSTVSHLTDNHTRRGLARPGVPAATGSRSQPAPSPSTAAAVGGGEPARRLLEKRRNLDRRVFAGEHAGYQLTADPLYRDEEPMWSSRWQAYSVCQNRPRQQTGRSG